jgi:phage/plasmid-associated DNA primase
VDPERATGAKYEFPKNTSLQQEFPSWAPYFFVLLTKFYELYKREGLRQPQEIKDATNSYRKECDAYSMFLDSSLETCKDSVLRLDEAYAVFKEWFSNEFNEKAPNRSAFKTYMDKKLRQNYNKAGGKTGWEGWRLKRDEQEEDTDE